MFVYVSFTFCYFCFDLIEKYPEFDREIAANLKKNGRNFKNDGYFGLENVIFGFLDP